MCCTFLLLLTYINFELNRATRRNHQVVEQLRQSTIQGKTLDERLAYNEETVKLRKAGESTEGRLLYADYAGIAMRDLIEEALRWLIARGTKEAGDNARWFFDKTASDIDDDYDAAKSYVAFPELLLLEGDQLQAAAKKLLVSMRAQR